MGIMNKLLGREEQRIRPRTVPEDMLRGTLRQPDHATSIAAAKTVAPQRETLKSIVLRYAKDAGPGGFIDEELRGIEPSRPESSFRKRRTELTEKNWIIALPWTRPNSHGQDSTVWIHRDFAVSPPPLQSAKKAKRLSAEQERARIVAFLKQQNYPWLASSIERGDHLK